MPQYTVAIHKTVNKVKSKLPKANLNSFNKWINDLKKDPFTCHDGIFKAIKFQGDGPVYKKRFGDYRACFVIIEKEVKVLVFKLMHRKEVYKKK